MLRVLKPVVLILLILTGISCLTDPVDLGEHDDYVAQFDLVWETFDREYIGFNFVDVNWGEVYNQFRPEIGEIQSQMELIDHLLPMLALLEDLHVWFVYPGGGVHGTFVPYYQRNYNETVLWAYIDSLSTSGFTWWNSYWGYAMFDSIPYVMITACDSNFVVSDLDALIEAVPDAPAMIIDIRMNMGGNAFVAADIARRFCSEMCLAYYNVFREGPENHDFGTPFAEYNLPGGYCFNKPVITLIGRGSVSAAEYFAQRLYMLPSVTLAGDTTRGEVNAFSRPYKILAGGYEYTVTRMTLLAADSSTWIQETGVAPDVYIPATTEDFAQGIDPVLEYALEWAASQ